MIAATTDKIIKNHFFKNKKKGFFVEIGAFDGLEGSNCYYFENMQAWDGIAVEASKNHFSKLKKNRKCHVLNFAISSSEKDRMMLKGLKIMIGIIL